MSASSELINRKQSHFELCAKSKVEFRNKTTLLEDVELIHHPLIETCLEDIDLTVEVFGKRLNYPIVITGMTGGTEEVGKFNKEVALLAQRLGIGFGLGSQRVMLRYPELISTFHVREQAPDVLLFGNIGIAQAREMSSQEIKRLADDVGADAICLHLNAAMEVIQFDGDQDFRGSLDAVKRIVAESGTNIILKETGCGFDYESGAKLKSAGVQWIDVSGAGGTSWVGVETIRNKAKRELGEAFWDWGVPTAASLCELESLKMNLIASGGIRTGTEAVKSLALGAKLAGFALPVVRAYVANGIQGVEEFINGFIDELRIALMLIGCSSVNDISRNRIMISGKLNQLLSQRHNAVTSRGGGQIG